MRSKTENPELIGTIRLLRRKYNETGAAVWRDLAKKLDRTKHNRTYTNISKINRCSKDNETIIVPGKVLGAGNIDHSVLVAAFEFSGKAREKILRTKGECITLHDLIERNPKGSKSKMIG